MGRKFLRLFSVLLVIAIAVTSFSSVAVSAKSVYTVQTLGSEFVKNPYYEGIDTSVPSADYNKSKQYYSQEPDFDPQDYTSDSDEIISSFRAAMVNRESNIVLCYKDENTQINGQLISNWLQEAISETENPNEGDYLKYVYSGYGDPSVTTYNTEEPQYYYHKITIPMYYYTTKAQEDEVDSKISEIIEGFGFDSDTTERQKSDIIYDYITDNVTYDHENLNNPDYTLKFTAYAALINGTAVCQGYATLFYRLARECGLDARFIGGNSMGENHAWNIVKIGDCYYYADSTWDAGCFTYSYYLKGADDFYNHTCEDGFSTPDFTSKHPIASQGINIVASQTQYEGDYEYYTYASKALITKYNGNAKNLVIPSKLDRYPVKGLGSLTIQYNDTIETITFSEGIRFMDADAIHSCYALKTLNFPSTMGIDYEVYTENGAYSGYSSAPNFCGELETVTIASGNTKMKLIDGIIYSMDEKTVVFCPAKHPKSEITLPEGIVTIAPMAFNNCENIKKLTMPDTVKYIGYWAFDGASSLESINISNACEIIGQYAFSKTALTSVHIPAATKNLVGNPFGPTCRLESITVDPENERYCVKDNALLSYNSETEKYAILDYEIGNPATKYTVPDYVDYICQYAFAETNLESVFIPSSVKSIDSFAFLDSRKLNHVTLPNSLETINHSTFMYCTALMSVIVPESVTVIEDISIGYSGEGHTVYGKPDSTAQNFCASNNLNFKNISEFKCQDGHTIKRDDGENYWQNVCTVCGDRSMLNYRTYIESVTYEGAVLNQDSFQYTGSPIEPTIVSIMDGEKKLAENTDYKILRYECNVDVGMGYIVVEGIGDYCGTSQISFEITPITEGITAEFENSSVPYTGYEAYPDVIVKDANGNILERFEDYDVEYFGDRINCGTYEAQVNLFGAYGGQKRLSFKIIPQSSGIKATLSSTSYTYDTKVKTPVVTVTNEYGETLKNGTDYTVNMPSGRINAGVYSVKVNMKGNYSGTKSLSFKINPASGGIKATLSSTSYTYNGKVKTPSVTVKDSKGKTLKKNTDYTVSNQSGRKNVGKYKVTIKFKGNYSGSKTLYFTIKPVKTTVKSITAGKKQLKVNITKKSTQVTGYQIQYSTSKKFTSAKTKTINSYKTTSATLKSLKAKKTYYVRIRTFKTVGKTKYYSAWSSAKSKKTK